MTSPMARTRAQASAPRTLLPNRAVRGRTPLPPCCFVSRPLLLVVVLMSCAYVFSAAPAIVALDEGAAAGTSPAPASPALGPTGARKTVAASAIRESAGTLMHFLCAAVMDPFR